MLFFCISERRLFSFACSQHGKEFLTSIFMQLHLRISLFYFRKLLSIAESSVRQFRTVPPRQSSLAPHDKCSFNYTLQTKRCIPMYTYASEDCKNSIHKSSKRIYFIGLTASFWFGVFVSLDSKSLIVTL